MKLNEVPWHFIKVGDRVLSANWRWGYIFAKRTIKFGHPLAGEQNILSFSWEKRYDHPWHFTETFHDECEYILYDMEDKLTRMR